MTSAGRTIHDNDSLRGVFGLFATGITVVTAGRVHPHGMTANSFTSVSMDPPMVLVCVRREARMHQAMLDSGSFTVSVLSGRQEHVARHFASSKRPRGVGEFDTVDSVCGTHTGVPIVANSLAWLECALAEVHAGGDHSIFLGEVLDVGRGVDRDALLFYGGAFHRLNPGTA